YIMSVISHLFIVAALWSILMAIGVEVAPVGALWMMIIGSLSLLLPIAVNGMGLLEGAYVVVLGSYGVPPSIGLGVALIMRGVSLLVSLLGGLLMLNQRALKIKVS